MASAVVLTGVSAASVAQAAGAINAAKAAPAKTPAVSVPVVPKSPANLPATVDDAAAYDGQSLCDPAPKPGAVKLAGVLNATYGGAAVQVTRGCTVGGQSEHKEGRALDWMRSIRNAKDAAQVSDFLAWLMATDAAGNQYAMARRLGVMYVAWNNKMWRAYDPGRGWAFFKGCDAANRQVPGWDTTCHRNHVHISLSWDGAAGLTSFYSGKAVTTASCSSWYSSPGPVPAASNVTFTASVPRRVFNSTTGAGVPGVCRVTAPRWSSDSRKTVIKVAGVSGVPATGVRAVLVRVIALRGNSPAPVTIGASGGTPGTAITIPTSKGAGSITTAVPLGVDGSLTVSTTTGAVDVIVDVLGWYTNAETVQSPRPQGFPAITSTFAATARTVYASGPIAKASTKTLGFIGRAGLPKSSLRSVTVVASTYSATRTGRILVTLANGTPLASLPYAAGRTIGTTVVIPIADAGRIVLRNKGSVAVRMRFDLVSFTAASGRTTRDTTMVSPRTIHSTKASAGPREITVVKVAGVGAVPATNVRAVLVQVASSKSTVDGFVQLWGSGGGRAHGRSAGVQRGVAGGSVIAVPVGTDGSIAISSTTAGLPFSVRVLGWLRR